MGGGGGGQGAGFQPNNPLGGFLVEAVSAGSLGELAPCSSCPSGRLAGQKERMGRSELWKVGRGGSEGRPRAGSRLWNVGGFRPQRQGGLQGSQERRGETHIEELRPRTETGVGRRGTREELGEVGTGGQVIWAHSSPQRHPLLRDICPQPWVLPARSDAGSLAPGGPGGPPAPGFQPRGSGS